MTGPNVEEFHVQIHYELFTPSEMYSAVVGIILECLQSLYLAAFEVL